MAQHNELGKEGEKAAVDFLQHNGYEILETNWTFQKAEVDIIAQKGNILAIVEVKTRSSIDFGFWIATRFCKTQKDSIISKSS